VQVSSKFMSPLRANRRPWRLFLSAGLLAAWLPVTPARSQLAVSQLIVDLKPGSSRAHDIELFNESAERTYISVEPREVTNPGTAKEQRFVSPDPEKLGILVSPTRLILEPRQRRTLRIALIGREGQLERVYRVTVKPVVGEVNGTESGLKLLVGYDLLILARPATIRSAVEVRRSGKRLMIANHGNASVELADGRQCDAKGRCHNLPSKRLYAGASWEHSLPLSTEGEYRVRSSSGWSSLKF
jgi:P pilus assembly chaperone PapD